MTEQQQQGGGPAPSDDPHPRPPQAAPHGDSHTAVLLSKVGDALRGSAPLAQEPRSVAPVEPEQQRPQAGAASADPSPRPVATPRPSVPRTGVRPPAGTARQRRARLRLRRIDPWSVFVLALLVSLFLAVVLVVAVVALYAVLEAAGVPDSVNALVAEVTRSPGEAEPAPLLSAGRALTTAGVVAVVDVVLLTALATLSAVLYNLCAGFTGGLEVTLAEEG